MCFYATIHSNITVGKHMTVWVNNLLSEGLVLLWILFDGDEFDLAFLLVFLCNGGGQLLVRLGCEGVGPERQLGLQLCLVDDQIVRRLTYVYIAVKGERSRE